MFIKNLFGSQIFTLKMAFEEVDINYGVLAGDDLPDAKEVSYDGQSEAFSRSLQSGKHLLIQACAMYQRGDLYQSRRLLSDSVFVLSRNWTNPILKHLAIDSHEDIMNNDEEKGGFSDEQIRDGVCVQINAYLRKYEIDLSDLPEFPEQDG